MNTRAYPVNHSNPYQSIIREAMEEAHDLHPRLEAAARRLADAILVKRHAASSLDIAKKNLEETKATVIFHEELDPNSQLKGIAKTSKSYGYALDALLALNSRVIESTKNVLDYSLKHDTACIEYDQAETLYNALRYKSSLLSAMLTAQHG